MAKEIGDTLKLWAMFKIPTEDKDMNHGGD